MKDTKYCWLRLRFVVYTFIGQNEKWLTFLRTESWTSHLVQRVCWEKQISKFLAALDWADSISLFFSSAHVVVLYSYSILSGTNEYSIGKHIDRLNQDICLIIVKYKTIWWMKRNIGTIRISFTRSSFHWIPRFSTCNIAMGFEYVQTRAVSCVML